MGDGRHRRACWFTFCVVALTAAAAHGELIELAYYRLGEDDGNVSVGDALTGSVDRVDGRDMSSSGSLAYSNDTPPMITSGLSVEFDGDIGDYLFSEAVPWHTLYPGLRVGMEAFLKIDEEIDGSLTVPIGNGTGYSLSVGENGFLRARGSEQTSGGQTPINYGEWQHVAFWTTGSVWQVYVDGEPQFDFDALPRFPYNSPSGSATIGADQEGASRVVGLIDEMRVFTWTGPFNPADLLFFSLRNQGDVNDDGSVDQADYNIWRANVGADLGDLKLLEGRALGDLNGDRSIDLSDFGLIKANKSPGANIPVPEPTGPIAIAAATLFAFGRIRRRGCLSTSSQEVTPRRRRVEKRKSRTRSDE